MGIEETEYDEVVQCDHSYDRRCPTTYCSKWPKEVCRVSKKNVKKYTPITGCTKEPRELCAPAGCGFKEGREECYEKTQTVVQDHPKEGQEARCQEVVLCAHRGVWSCLRDL